MKPVIQNTAKLMVLFFIGMASFNTMHAQTPKKDREAKQVADIKKMVDARAYIFMAEFANPMSGGNRSLTSGYDLTVGKDTLIAYLPFFGRAYVAPIDPTEGGIKFTSTKFEYIAKPLKKGGWEITFKPKDTKDVRQMFLTISENGYATLYITNNDRDAISFQGYITGRKS